MKIKLYALKCDEGYIKIDSSLGFTIVPLEKAAVFNEAAIKNAGTLIEHVKSSRVNNPRLVELLITEKDPAEGMA